MTGGRLRRVSEYLKDESDFCFTYGDGVGDIDIAQLIAFHKSHKKIATVTATVPPGRFGALKIINNEVQQFDEKPMGDGSRINGGYFVLRKEALEFIESDHTSWEQEPLSKLASIGELAAYKHDGFWQPMDTLRDKIYLEKLWSSGNAPWKIWDTI
jgi:glucose-1-phosphate cytidylyltransferase